MDEIEKLDLESTSLIDERIERLRELFPEVFAESGIDFEKLRLELGDDVDEGSERYAFTWPGKAKAIRLSQQKTRMTLRPCLDDSIDWGTTQNLYIEGDNLKVLQAMLKSYFGAIKLIYIDPPYNTNGDFVYSDKFGDSIEDYIEQCGISNQASPDLSGRKHARWCTFMYSRLRIARDLLRKDGLLLVNIDEHEYVNLQNILREVFGEGNDLGTIVWDKRNPKGDATGVSAQHEYIVVYAKNKDEISDKSVLQRPKKNAQAMLDKAAQLFARVGSGYTLEDANKDFRGWIKQKTELTGGEKAYNNIDENGEVYQPVSMAWPNKKKAPDDYFVPLIHPVTGKECPVPPRGWRNPSSTMQELLSRGLVLFGRDETTQPRRKYLLRENMMENIPSLLYNGSSDTALLESMEIPFDTPKVTDICTEHIQYLTSDDDIILDFFSGSATTAHATMKANAADGGKRRFIQVQLPEPCAEGSEAASMGYANICELGRRRIAKAGEMIAAELEKAGTLDRKPDVGFRVFRLDKSGRRMPKPGELMVDLVESDRSPLDIVFEMALKWGLDLSYPVEKLDIDGYSCYTVAGDALICCLENGLTVPVIEKIAELRPDRVFILDSVLDDSLKLNALQVFGRIKEHTQHEIDLKTV